MKAIVSTQYGSPDVLKFKDVDTPTPKDDEVLVKIHAASVNAGDWHLLRGEPFPVRMIYGLRKPNNPILGSDVAGTVEAVGGSVTQFKVGDAVFGDLSICGFGAFAEYVAVPESALVKKPDSISFEDMASVPVAAVTALQGVRDKGQIQSGQKVLINGASGSVGMFAVQIAKSFGAEVTGVSSTSKLDMVRSIGADHVVDYKQEDVTQNGQHYDLIVDTAANRSVLDYRRIMKEDGIYVMIGGDSLLQVMLVGPWVSMTSNQKMGNMLVKPNNDDLIFMRDLLEAGKVKPVIDRYFPLNDVPDAIRYLEAGKARGKVIISIA